MATLLLVVLASLVLFAASVAAMAIGLMLRRPCLRRGCGARAPGDAGGARPSCTGCPHRGRGDGDDTT